MITGLQAIRQTAAQTEMKMITDMWILALCFTCFSSVLETCQDVNTGVVQKLVAPLGSSVLLPCTMMTHGSVSWVQSPEKKLLNLSPGGLITFLDPRGGRLKAFPNQGSQGNFSIRIDELEHSDRGCYRCSQTDASVQVELAVDHAETQSDRLWSLVHIFAAVAVLSVKGCSILLILSCRNTCTVNNAVAENEGADNIIYENADPHPDNFVDPPTSGSTWSMNNRA